MVRYHAALTCSTHTLKPTLFMCCPTALTYNGIWTNLIQFYLIPNSHFPFSLLSTQVIAANCLATKEDFKTELGVIFQSPHFPIYSVYITYATELLGKRHLIFVFVMQNCCYGSVCRLLSDRMLIECLVCILCMDFFPF